MKDVKKGLEKKIDTLGRENKVISDRIGELNSKIDKLLEGMNK